MKCIIWFELKLYSFYLFMEKVIHTWPYDEPARGDRIALISGTPEQKRAAENLIQAFIMATWIIEILSWGIEGEKFNSWSMFFFLSLFC